MGTWGPAILSNDLASDVRDEWKEMLGDGISPEDATALIIKAAKDDHILNDEVEEYEFWLSFSLIQWKTGRLQKEVKQKALSFLKDKKINRIEMS